MIMMMKRDDDNDDEVLFITDYYTHKLKNYSTNNDTVTITTR
jgi:hypothetical protein